MISIPEADFRTHRANLSLTQNSYTEVVFTFSDLNFTGYTDDRFIWCTDDGLTKALITTVRTDDVNGIITVQFDAAAWTAIDGELTGDYQLEIVDGSSNLKILAIGSTIHELSKTFP